MKPALPDKDVQPRRPRGRPRKEDLAALEARLILVGSELFFDQGYGDTTMSAVARAARVSKTTLYARFPSKAALFRAIVAAQIESWDTGINHVPIKEYDRLDETLSAYGDVVLRAAMTPDFVQLHRLLYSESERFPELGEVAGARFGMGVRSLAGHIRTFAERDDWPCRDPVGAAELFLVMLMGWCSAAIIANRSTTFRERRAWLDKVVQSFMAGRSTW